MTFKVKRKRDKIPEGYWKEREIRDLRKKYRKKGVPFTVITNQTTRVLTGVPKKIHKENTMVMHKEKPHVVRKVTKKGVYLSEAKTGEGLIRFSKKQFFVPEKEYRKTTYPVFAGLTG